MLINLEFKSVRDVEVYVDGISVLSRTLSSHPHYEHLRDDLLLCNKTEHVGVYETGAFNFDHRIDIFTDYQTDRTVWGYKLDAGESVTRDQALDYLRRGELADEYGVADNINQVLQRFKKVLESSTDQYVVAYVTIIKADQEHVGGWRRSKWGKYIGTQDWQCEYLFDEPVIEEVICFKVHRIASKDVEVSAA